MRNRDKDDDLGVEQVGLQTVGEKPAVAPWGRPETVKEAAWVVPEDKLALTVFVTDWPWVTARFCMVERLKSKLGVG